MEFWKIIKKNTISEDELGKGTDLFLKHRDFFPQEWYDELYQMILLVILEMDNKERMEKIDGLKKAITGGK